MWLEKKSILDDEIQIRLLLTIWKDKQNEKLNLIMNKIENYPTEYLVILVKINFVLLLEYNF